MFKQILGYKEEKNKL